MFGISPIQALKALFAYGPGHPPQARMHDPSANLANVLQRADAFVDPAWAFYENQMKVGAARLQIYKEMEEMDADDIVAAAAELYAEDATQMDTVTGKTIWVNSKNPKIKDIGDAFMDDIDAEDKAYPICRNLTMYGDDFENTLQSIKDDGNPGGIVGITNIPQSEIHRHTDELGRLMGFSRGPIPDLKRMSMPWDYVHFRLLGLRRHGDYGTPLFVNARRLFRSLRMHEDALTCYRLKMAPDRLKFMIDCKQMSPADRYRFINELRQQFRKRNAIDPATGQYRTDLNPMSIDDSIWYPLGEDDKTDIGKIVGTQTMGNVLDVDYMRRRLYSTLKVPAEYLGFSTGQKAGFLSASSLSIQDIRFARGVRRIQRSLIDGFTRLLKIHLCWCGVDVNTKENEFSILMNAVSYLDEIQKGEYLKLRAQTMASLQSIGEKLGLDQSVWMKYVWKFSGFPEEVVFPGGTQGDPVELTGEVMVERKELEKIREVLSDGSVRKMVLEATSLSNGTFMEKWPKSRVWDDELPTPHIAKRVVTETADGKKATKEILVRRSLEESKSEVKKVQEKYAGSTKGQKDVATGQRALQEVKEFAAIRKPIWGEGI
jgi:hypothetical protein